MLYAPLRKLPRILPDALTPKYLIFCVSQYDSDIWAITVTVYHVRPTKLLLMIWIVPQFTSAEKNKGAFAASKHAFNERYPANSERYELLCWLLRSFSNIITWCDTREYSPFSNAWAPALSPSCIYLTTLAAT